MIRVKIDNNSVLKAYVVGLILGRFTGLLLGYAIWGLK